jgi:hypothetical protein
MSGSALKYGINLRSLMKIAHIVNELETLSKCIFVPAW